MQYVKPKWVVALTLLVAIISSFSMPLNGIFSARYQYIIYNHAENENFVFDRNSVTWQWLLVTAAMGLGMSTERMLVGIGGENLTLNVRKELIRAILYK